jgi:protease IV
VSNEQEQSPHSRSVKHSSNRSVAVGLLAACVLSLGVGLFNALTPNETPAKNKANGDNVETSDKSSIAAILGASVLKKDHLAIIPIRGAISSSSPQNSNGLFGNEAMAVTARKAMYAAAKDKSIKGVLLWIDSPGGTVGMSQELNTAVKALRKEKPVVASLGDVAASGGYYTACAADKIVANPGTLTASIGVIIHGTNLKGLLTDKLGVKDLTIKSGKFKDILSPFRDARPDELVLLQDLINDSYRMFLNEVIDGRTRQITDVAVKKARTESITAVADGRIVSGNQGKIVGLVDELGSLEDAKHLLDKMAKERFHLTTKEELPVEEYNESFELFKMIGLGSQTASPSPLSATLMGLLKLPASAAMVAQPATSFSARYPNQPLWIYE